MKLDFEKQHFQQSIYWVGGFSFDLVKSELKLSLIANPDVGSIDGTVIFHGVEKYIGEFDLDEYDNDCIESLICINAFKKDKVTEYVINFSVGEIGFSTSLEPEVKWKNPNKISTYKPCDEFAKVET